MSGFGLVQGIEPKILIYIGITLKLTPIIDENSCMERKIRIPLLHLLIPPRRIVAGLVLYFGLAGPLWAPVNPGWCKNNTLLNPLANLSFGTFMPEAAGRVVVAVTGVVTAPDGGIILLGGASQAVFAITGCPDNAYSIIIPPDSTLSLGGGGTNPMTLTSFTSYPAGSGILDANGDGQLQFGATLNVNSPQPNGSYSGTYTVEIVIQ